jgi:t-SNARE complex subunit (syntaxin)
VRTLHELRQFKTAGNPFTDEFFDTFDAVYQQQLDMLKKLQQRQHRLDKKVKTIQAWRRVSSIIFATTFAAVLICSIVAAVIAAPPVAAALAAAAAVPLGSMGKWFDSLLKGCQDAVNRQEGVVSEMQFGTLIAIKDLENIKVLIKRVEEEISSMIDCVEFAERDEEAVKFGVEEIKKKLESFMKSVEDLGEQADRCTRHIHRARTLVLGRIIRHPN